ncbi:sialate O-acetylesterase [Brachybacterium sp.]|uniref:sialate O-acetylesterase n=1 Tax=Brachybacterium sp. TaxID=1891286 RepID=UPI002ED6A98A
MADHLVVLLGQSNANGSNTDYEPDGIDARDPRILTVPASGQDEGRLVPAREPLASAGAHPPGGLGPAGPFAALLLADLEPTDRVVIVPMTLGGTGMRRHGSYPGVWLPGYELAGAPDLFARAVEHVRLALGRCEEPRIAAVLWHQGESDGGRPEADYAADLDLLISTFRAEIPEAAEAPFLVGQMARERLLAQPDHRGVHDALARTPERMARTGYAEAPPLGHINDGSTHFTAAGQRLLGAQYFESYRSVIAQADRTAGRPVRT